MAENSKIEWTDHTFNPWEGCQKVGPGCDHCYAETRNARFAGGRAVNWGPGAPRRRTSAANWRKPLSWNGRPFYQCLDCGWRGHGAGKINGGLPVCPVPKCASLRLAPARARVFCASLADVFDNAVDPAWREDLYGLFEATPSLDWLLLTKRIGNVGNMLPVPFDFNRIYPNVWLGATIVNQAEADRDIPKLLELPARVRFLSMEPLLGPVDLGTACRRAGLHLGEALDWVIVGGESGPGARPMHPAWAASLRDQCQDAGVPFLFKQWGEWAPGSGDFGAGGYDTAAVAWDGRVARDDYPVGATSADGWSMVHRPGKVAAGRLLDGSEWNEVPR
ncbi:phage Gp37/Gp68 family protein [Achromobacter xylosoxidans]